MKNKINLPRYTAESPFSLENNKFRIVKQVANNGNNIEPQWLMAAFAWALPNAAYAGCWWACVADKGMGQAVECRSTCEFLKF